MGIDLFDACSEGNLELVKKQLTEEADLTLFNDYGFTALHCAAMGSDGTDPEINIEILKLLVEAGSKLETKSKDGRTALYLLAEFSQSIAPVQYLIDEGADIDIYDENDNHIIENAWAEDVQKLLAESIGVPTPEESGSKLEQIKMETKNWKKAKADIDLVFQKLTASGFIALQDAGYTQSDGFSDCSEAYHKHLKSKAILGFCFYTRQDLERAKNTSILMLGYWGAPDGEDEATEKVGRLIIEAFEQENFEVHWSGESSDRPLVLLHTYSN
jgi:bifunctional non-homologous end joining protein LigD